MSRFTPPLLLVLALLAMPLVASHTVNVSAAPAGWTAQVRYIFHGLSVQPPGKKMRRGTRNMSLFNRYFLRTQARQRASIGFRDGTALHMNQRTDVELRSPNLTYVRRGEVDQVVRPGTTHTVQTGTVVTGAIGTEYDTRVSGTTTVVIVVHGAVLAQNAKGSVLIKTNQESVIAKNKAPTKAAAVNAQSATSWTHSMPAPNLGDNLALDANGGKATATSSNTHGGSAGNVNDGRLDTGWESAVGSVYHAGVTLSLGNGPAGRQYDLSEVIVDPADIPSKDSKSDIQSFQILVSTTGTKSSQFFPVLQTTAKQSNTLQHFTLPAGTRGRYVQILALTNYGGSKVGIAEVEVVGKPSTTSGATASVAVDSQANVFRAGHPVQAPGGGLAPPMVAIRSGAGKVLTIRRATGLVNCAFGAKFNGPDGDGCVGGATDINSILGVAGIVDHQSSMFLVGVFLTNAEPANPAPPRLDFSNNALTMHFTTLSPKIGQAFFIGDGLTGTGTGSVQQFVVPSNATRLCLGFADAAGFHGNPGFYDDDSGSLAVDLRIAGS